MNTITTHFFKLKNKKDINKVLIVFALLFMTIQASWGQQVIGEFPDLNGGFESFTTGTLGTNATLISGTQYPAYSLTSTSSQQASIAVTPSRSGGKTLTWGTSGTNKKLYSTTVNINGGIANNTAYTVQFWYQTSKSNTLGSSPTIAISPDGSANVGTASPSTIATSMGVWVFKQISVTSGTSAAATKYGAIVFAADNFSNTNLLSFDDLCVYAGAADNSSPTAATSASTTVVSGSALNVNWTGLLNAGDGGGYVIVRSTSATAVTLNQNGIYAVGNTSATGAGTIVGIVPGVAGANIFSDSGLTPGITYYYSIFAVDKAFNYATPVTCNGTTPSSLAPQTITFGALSAVTYGDASFNLTATASSGLPVTYTSSDPTVATISGSTVTMVGSGTTVITASQAGNSSWAAATPVVQNLTVNKKTLTVSGAVASNKVYDGTTAATISGTLVGIINSDVVTLTGTGTFASPNVGTAIAVTSTCALAGTDAGKYILTQPTGLSADITIGSQVITLAATATVYSEFADYSPATSNISNPITYTSSNPAVATIVGNQVHYVGIGVTTITASQAATSNCTAATDKSQILTVTLKPIAAWNFWTSGSTTQYTKTAYIFDAGLDATSTISVSNASNVNGSGTSVSSVTLNTISRGAGVSASGGTSAFRTTGFPTSAPTPPVVDATNTKYFQITLQATTGKTISLSTIDAYFYDSGNGFNASPGAISQFGYSLDGGTTVVPIGSPIQSTSLKMGQIDVSGIAALQDVPSGTTITLRYYASGYAAQGWGFGSPNAGAPAVATDGLVIRGDVSDSTTWTGTTTSGSWSNGIPSATKNAIILGAFDTSVSTGGGFTAKKLTVNGSGTLLIKSGTAITVKNQVINNAGANGIVVEDTGSLVQVNDVTPANNAGVIKYSRKTTKISNMDYTYWSSPVQGFTLGGVSPNTFKFYSYNSTLQDWQQESSTTAMTPGVGYIVRGPQLSTYMSPNPPAIYEATFSGVPNNGHYQISGMVANKLYLIGNPYPSALDADAFIDGNQNVLDGTLYFWTHNTPIATSASNPGIYAYSGNDYASYNRTGGTSTASVALNPGISSVAPNGKIASGQGFFVNGKNPALTNGDTTIDFYNSMRVGVGGITGNNSQFFKTNTTMDKNRVWLDLTNDQGVFKQILVGYVTGATNDYDSLFDGDTFDANPYVDFYSINQNKNLVIQGRSLPFDENDVVPLGFKTTITGPLTIGIENTDGLFVNQNIFIEDLLTNTITNLKNENYTFNATPGTFNDRFVLKYTNSALGLNTNTLDYNNIIVYKNNDAININSGKLVMDNVKVYDLQGRLVLEQKNVNATTTSIKNLKATQQVLIVKVTTQDNTVVTKKVIN